MPRDVPQSVQLHAELTQISAAFIEALQNFVPDGVAAGFEQRGGKFVPFPVHLGDLRANRVECNVVVAALGFTCLQCPTAQHVCVTVTTRDQFGRTVLTSSMLTPSTPWFMRKRLMAG